MNSAGPTAIHERHRAGGRRPIVLTVPSLGEGAIPDRVAVHASMRACVILADVSAFGTGALRAVALLGRTHGHTSHIRQSGGIYAAGLFNYASNEALLRADG